MSGCKRSGIMVVAAYILVLLGLSGVIIGAIFPVWLSGILSRDGGIVPPHPNDAAYAAAVSIGFSMALLVAGAVLAYLGKRVSARTNCN